MTESSTHDGRALTSARWKPNRAGILNVWEYDDEVFEFGDGRLVLRGRNGSGKSNALALLFPFLLEGVMGAMRMDPMGGARSMKSLLLGRDDSDGSGGRFQHDSRVGYLWLEFARDGERITIGAGVSATTHREARAWFFVTDQIVGVDLDLCRDDTPRSRRELAELLGANSVFDTAEQYRSRVDRELFGLGAERQRGLTDLLLTLRRPHLAGKLDADSVSATLAAGLTALDETMLQDVAHSFEDLDAMAADLDGVRTSRATVDRFLPAYRRYLIGAGRERADALIQADRERRRIDRERSASQDELHRANTHIELILAELERHARSQRSAESEIETIRDSPAYRSSVALGEVERASSTATGAAEGAGRRAAKAGERADVVQVEHDRAVDSVVEAEAADQRAVADWRTTAASVGLAVLAADDDFDLLTVRAAITSRDAEVAELELAVTERDRADDAAAQARTRWESAQEQLAQSAAALQERKEAVETGEAELRQELDEWVSELDRGVKDSTSVLASTSPDPATPTGATVVNNVTLARDDFDWNTLDLMPVINAVQPALGSLEQAMSEQRRRRSDLEAELAGSRAERHRVATEPNPGPPPNPTRPDAVSPTAVGVPLYVCVDFEPSLSEADRAGLEAALDAAGLLDARVLSPTDVIGGLHDAVLEASPNDATSELPFADSLRSALVPVATERVDEATIDAVLRSLPLTPKAGSSADLVAIGADGHWRLGPVSGRFVKEQPEFVGHQARERRREARLVELDLVLAGIIEAIDRSEHAERQLSEVAGMLNDSLGRAPSLKPLVALRSQADRAADRVAVHSEQEATTRRSSEESVERAADCSIRVQRIGARLGLETSSAAVHAARSALTECRHRLDVIGALRRSLAIALASRIEADRRLVAAKRDADDARREAAELEADATIAAQRYALLRADVGADADAAVTALAAARVRLHESKESEQRAQVDRRATDSTIATQTERLTQLEGLLARGAEHVEQTAQRVATVARPEVLDVVGITDIDETADPLEVAKAFTMLDRVGSIEDGLEAAPTEDIANLMERAYRTILLDGLRDGHQPSQHKVDGLDLVRVGTTDGDVPIGALARLLAENEERLGQLLTKREREIFETHLLTRVADGLRHLLLAADDFERRINSELIEAPTSSQMRVELKWSIDTDEPGVASAVKLLRFSADTIAPQQREELRTFFTDRIASVRSLDQGRSFQDVLSEALDYRRWHRFDLFARFSDGVRRPITRTFFRSLSGGEAATVLHLPLFAAAAAHYSSGTVAGPRIIALDEAFAGIDDQTRGRLMGLLVQLDLDMLLTSHELWGTYGEVPELSIYDLNRKPPTPGVFARHIAWQGRAAGTDRLSGQGTSA